MDRIDYFNDPSAPKANSIIPAASAIITDADGKILLHRRTDNELWALPGGIMDIGESIADTIIREVKEETGLKIYPEYIIGIYTNPNHVIALCNGEVRQQFSICFYCHIVGGEIRVSNESYEVAFFSNQDIEYLNMHSSIRLRIQHYLEQRKSPFFS